MLVLFCYVDFTQLRKMTMIISITLYIFENRKIDAQIIVYNTISYHSSFGTCEQGRFYEYVGSAL